MNVSGKNNLRHFLVNITFTFRSSLSLKSLYSCRKLGAGVVRTGGLCTHGSDISVAALDSKQGSTQVQIVINVVPWGK